MKINDLTLYDPQKEKIRFGKIGDGGYVGVNVPCSLLLSGGIGGDISFELAIEQSYKCKCILFDMFTRGVCAKRYGSLDKFLDIENLKSSSSYQNLNFVEKWISDKNDNEYTNLSEELEALTEQSDVFLKLDIEGPEYDFFKSVSINNLNKVNQIFVEFHKINQAYKSEKWNVFSKINQTHRLIHIHGNNCGKRPLVNIDGLSLPKAVELTYLHKKFLNTPTINKQPLPLTGIDYPNNYRYEEYDLNFFPFVDGAIDP